MSEAAPGRVLPWDSEFFGLRIARAQAPRLSRAGAQELAAWARAEGVVCTYFLADPDDAASVRAAEAAGMRLVDVRVTFERALEDAPASAARVDLAGEADVPQLRAIAAASHRDGRFHHDGGFPAARCDELYATWIENSCRGFADAVLVTRDELGAASGYVSCHLDQDAGRIGLIAVGAHARGRGLGRTLVDAALAWFARHGRARATVVTQGRNVPALRLYESLGFRTRSLELWYHLWTADVRGDPQ